MQGNRGKWKSVGKFWLGTLKIQLAGKLLYHSFGIVPDLPVDLIVGGDVMKPHACSLKYHPTGRNEFLMGEEKCESCTFFHSEMERRHDEQLTHQFKKLRSSPAICREATAPQCYFQDPWILRNTKSNPAINFKRFSLK